MDLARKEGRDEDNRELFAFKTLFLGWEEISFNYYLLFVIIVVRHNSLNSFLFQFSDYLWHFNVVRMEGSH